MDIEQKLYKIRRTVLKIGRAKTVKEIDNQKIEFRVTDMCIVIIDCNHNKIKEPAASEMIAAFLSEDPSKAYRNLVELRSGRSLCDQSGSVRQTAVLIDLESKNSHFSVVYRNFNSSFQNSMVRRSNVMSLYVFGGCIEAALRELRSMDFKYHKNDSPEESPTAASICRHLGLIYSVSAETSLKQQLRAELQKNSYFPILSEFVLSKYVHSQLVLSFFLPSFLSFIDIKHL